MKPILYNKSYVYSTLLMSVFTYILNFCTSIYQCSLVFVIIATMANFITFFYGKSESLKSLVFAIIITYTLMLQRFYYIDGKIINGLISVSLLSLMISIYWSTFVFQKLTNKISLIISNMLSLISAALIDCLVMSIFFAFNSYFSYFKILDIFSRELSYKMIYGFLVSVITFIVLKIFRISSKLNRNFNS